MRMFELKLCNFPCFISFRLLEIHFCSFVFCALAVAFSWPVLFYSTRSTPCRYSTGYHRCGCQSSISVWRILSPNPRFARSLSLSVSASHRLFGRLGQPLNALGALLLRSQKSRSCAKLAIQSKCNLLPVASCQSHCPDFNLFTRLQFAICHLLIAFCLLPSAFSLFPAPVGQLSSWNWAESMQGILYIEREAAWSLSNISKHRTHSTTHSATTSTSSTISCLNNNN